MNTDGASRENPERSSYGFCVRDSHGDLIYAEADYIGESTNMIVEAITVKEDLTYGVSHLLNALLLRLTY